MSSHLKRFIIFLSLSKQMLHSKPMTVILDIGSYRTLAGIAGEENPHLSTYSYLTTDTSLKT